MRTTALLLAVALLVAACESGGEQAEQEPTGGAVTTPVDPASPAVEPPVPTDERSYAGSVAAPPFPANVEWLNTDRPLALEQLRGKVVLLDFWTYGCINCIHIIPELAALEEEFADELVVIGVHSAKFENEADTENIRRIILRYELEHPVVNDRNFEIWRTYGAQAWPTLVLIDPAGNVVGFHAGENVYELFQPVISSLVAEFDEQLDRTPLSFKLEREGLPQTVLSFPGKVLADPEGGRLFIADTNNNRVVVADLADGAVTAVIGSGELGLLDGPLETARLADPQGLALSGDGTTLYVADTENHAVRAVDLAAGAVTTVAGTGAKGWPPQAGPALEVALNSPWDLALDGDRLYIAMAGTHQLWELDLVAATVTPLVGSAIEGVDDGAFERAQLAQPSGLVVDEGVIYFADSEASSVRAAIPAQRQVDTIAGAGTSLFEFGDVDGAGDAVRFQHPLGVTAADGLLYVADTYNSKIKVLDPSTGEVSTLAGSDHGWRDGDDPLFYEPGGIHAAGGRLYVADTNNHAVRIVDPATGAASTVVLKGLDTFTEFSGEVVEVGEVRVAAGPGRVRLQVDLPPGYKPNDLAPSSFTWSVDGGAAVLAPDASRTEAGPEFPLEFDATFVDGRGTLSGDLTIYYCEAEAQELCLIEQVRLTADLVVDDSGGDVAVLRHRIVLPDLG